LSEFELMDSRLQTVRNQLRHGASLV
jgi:hypothetical protein